MAHSTGLISVTLGFRAFDVHELLVHSIARDLGFYFENNLEVTLKDLTFLPDDTPGVELTVACGAALMGWTKGIRRKVVLVATEYPMFWLHTSPRITKLADLKGARIATYPAASPPGQFLRSILRKHGLDPESDVQLEEARDDAARFGLLNSGDVAAAVISSALPPPKVQALGFKTLLFFGDEIRIPTTGLAVSERYLTRHPEIVERMTAALAEALFTVDIPDLALPVLARFLGDSPATAEPTYQLVRRYYSREGRASPEAAQNAVEMVNAQLPPGQKLTAKDIYDEAFL